MSSHIPHFSDLEIDIDSRSEVIAKSKELVARLKPSWNPSELKERIFSDGITNVLVGVYQLGRDEDDTVMVRLYGHNTAVIIDRQAEIENMKLFHESGCGSEIYATFKNGVAYSYIAGVIPSSAMIVEPKLGQLVIAMFSKMHRMRLGGKPCLWDRLRQLQALYPDGFPDDPAKDRRRRECGFPSREEVSKEIAEFETALKDCHSPVVFSHNDLLLGNIVYDERKEKVTFIDYEYGGSNFQAYDIANHFCEFPGVIGELDYDAWYPKEGFQKDWIAKYLREFRGGEREEEEVITADEIHRTYVLVNKFALCAHLLWGIWALVQAANSTLDFDFMDFGRQRLKELRRRKETFLALE